MKTELYSNLEIQLSHSKLVFTKPAFWKTLFVLLVMTIERNSVDPEVNVAFIYSMDISENCNIKGFKHGTKPTGGVLNRDHKIVL